ncbi:hypothetical protein G352_23986 [Rhodococcus ruber BKS 20-38]|uniref:Uncharacterized protein n=1 Tax=Rhodococcus ruber BKS 20-38 TaxID=1278076 RepID=M2XX24_9NOCA|nr:hypothetical protein [Rhodococcus ruber]EME53755.1 hypothetical protein G352_23986 [Rhodococcus ruber BKS 20-38]
MTLDMACPVCHAAFIPPEDAPAYPPDGSVAVCVTCADVVVWNQTCGWELPDADHKAELLELQPVIDSLMEIRQWHDQHEKDRQTLRSLISHGYLVGSSITDIVEAILDNGFHRHPDNAEDNDA